MPSLKTPYSIWRYLMLLAFLPFMAWQLSQQALSDMDVQFARQNPGTTLTMREACQSANLNPAGIAQCELRQPIQVAFGLAVGILLALKILLGLCAALPRLPKSIRIGVLRHAKFLTGVGLIVTWVMVAARGTMVVVAVWWLPQYWWGKESASFAALLAVFAICRLGPHAMTIWRMLRETRRFVVGKIIEPDEAPEIWLMVERACQRLQVSAPRHLILGMQPGARLETGTFLLEPRGQVVKGRSLYLGITLAQALGTTELETLIQSALSRAAGPHGRWLPEVQDALQNAHAVLEESLLGRRNGAINSGSDPALEAYAGWLSCCANLIMPFEDEDIAAACQRQAAGGEAMTEMERARAASLIQAAAGIWKEKVFPRFMLALSFGEKRPATQERFDAGLQEADHGLQRIGRRWRAAGELFEALVAKECEWMAQTGQVAIIGQSWELMGVHGAHKQDVTKAWDMSLRLN